MTMKNRGTWGEAEVAKYLRRKGYELLASQWRCRFGEIDLIARKGGILCFVEVKLRTNLKCGLPREFVDERKQGKLRAAASCYLRDTESEEIARFDVAEVYPVGEDGWSAEIVYLENAF